MRIGILEQQITNATDKETMKITFQGTPIYGGQAYRVTNFRAKKKLINSLFQRELISPTLKTVEIDKIFKKISNRDDFELSSAEFSQLTTLINQVNATLPIIKKVTSSFAPKQDEQVLNIKLPTHVASLDGLSEFNSRLIDLFKQFGLTNTNGLSFQGFDNGSEWYQVLIENSEFFKWVVFGVGLAWSCVKIRKDWFDSEISRLTLKAMKKNDQQKTLDKKDEVVKKIIDIKIQEEVDAAIENGLSMQGKSKQELKTQLIKAVHMTIEEIDNGTEFHLSLNPPAYLSEKDSRGLVEIDYSQIYQLPENNHETKELDQPQINVKQ